MTKQLFAGLVGILLLAGTSCKKETVGVNSPSPAISSQSSDELISEEAKLGLNGYFTFFYSWGCGTYSKTSIVINPNYTFTDGTGHSGTWVKNNKLFVFHYNNTSTTYSGKIGQTTVTGVAGSYSYNPVLKGCFQLVKGVVREKNEINSGETRTPSGEPR